MNGRVYDQIVGRFLSADPNVPRSAMTQSHNRFSYTSNRPLSFTDPSGFADAGMTLYLPIDPNYSPSGGSVIDTVTVTRSRIDDYSAELNANMFAFAERTPLHDLNTREFSWADAGVLEEVVTTDTRLEDEDPVEDVPILYESSRFDFGPVGREMLRLYGNDPISCNAQQVFAAGMFLGAATGTYYGARASIGTVQAIGNATGAAEMAALLSAPLEGFLTTGVQVGGYTFLSTVALGGLLCAGD